MCICATLTEFIQYATLIDTRLYSKYQNVRHIKNKKKTSKTTRHYKPLLSIIFLVTQVNWVVLDCPRGTCFRLSTEITCHSAPPQPKLVVHRHLRINFFNGTITFDYVPCHIRFYFLLLTLFFNWATLPCFWDISTQCKHQIKTSNQIFYHKFLTNLTISNHS